jgi:phospholipid/cholesterol/gamma-HCH transport system substrate-binding protein
MKKESSNKIRLGVFITAGFIILIVGIYFIGQKQFLFSHTITVKAIYKDVSGLQIGNNVRFSGIDVGTINDIEIVSDTAVCVTMAIDRSVRKFLKKDGKASIGSEGLMGDKVINLTAGTSESKEIDNNDYLQTLEGNNIDIILKQVKVSADNAVSITTDLAAIISNIKSGRGSVGKLLMDTGFADNLDKTMVNVKHATGGLNENMEAAKHNFLLRGYFKKKEKEAAKKAKEEEKQKNQE